MPYTRTGLSLLRGSSSTMCGICGYWTPAHTPLGAGALKAMNATLARRGPDGEGYFEADGVGLAMRRLAIIDLEGGWQPIYNEDRTVVVVMNGEIYNYRQLREKLLALGHRLATHSDTEVLVHLYETYGDDLTTHLEGMFAFALWDLKKHRLLVARDRLGIKPLYYSDVGQQLVFGSELKAVLAAGIVKTELDPVALDEYFTFNFIPAPRSIYKAVRKLAPAHRMIVESDGSRRIERYWSLPAEPAQKISIEDAEPIVEGALRSAVESHLVSDVPVGAFLSGGVDSGLIVAMAAEALDAPLSTYTIGFAESGRAILDERAYAREIANRYGCIHHEFEVQPSVAGMLAAIVTAFDEPFADDSVIPSYCVSELAAKDLKVALTGLGGDELFAGYRRHAGIKLDESLGTIGDFVRAALSGPINAIPQSWARSDLIDHAKRFARGSGRQSERYAGFLAAAPVLERYAVYSEPMRKSLISAGGSDDVVVRAFDAAPSGTALRRALTADVSIYLPDDVLTLTDRLSMWHSLELRVPFLDRALVELAWTLPDRMLINGREQKLVLRRIAERLLPKSVLRHRKQGFEAPMGSWLRGPLLALFDEYVNRATVVATGLLDWSTIATLREDHVAGRHKNSKVLFSLLMFMAWYRQASLGENPK